MTNVKTPEALEEVARQIEEHAADDEGTAQWKT